MFNRAAAPAPVPPRPPVGDCFGVVRQRRDSGGAFESFCFALSPRRRLRHRPFAARRRIGRVAWSIQIHRGDTIHDLAARYLGSTKGSPDLITRQSAAEGCECPLRGAGLSTFPSTLNAIRPESCSEQILRPRRPKHGHYTGTAAVATPTREAGGKDPRPRRAASARRHREDTDPLALAETFFPEPLPRDLPAALARQDAIRQLSERMAPTRRSKRSCRVAVSGCRPRDGASSIAAALALDLSQRLSMRTLLVDANLQSPSLHGVISPANGTVTQITLDGSLQLRSTGWPRLTLATCCPFENDDQHQAALAELGYRNINTFPAAVIDLGVARLDPRMVPLMRPTDPILLVVRYGQTERNELATTAAALRAADRTVAGVILNSRPSRLRTSPSECLDHE